MHMQLVQFFHNGAQIIIDNDKQGYAPFVTLMFLTGLDLTYSYMGMASIRHWLFLSQPAPFMNKPLIYAPS